MRAAAGRAGGSRPAARVGRSAGDRTLPACPWMALLLTLLLATADVARADPAAGRVLNVYNWSDFIGDDTIRRFERETGIRVRYDTFDSNEILHAKLIAGRTGYDIVVPSANWAKIQLDGHLLHPIDKRRIPNWSQLDPDWMRQLARLDPGNDYLVPWLGGFTTLGINVDRLKAALGSLPMPVDVWDLLFKPEYAARAATCGISVLDSGEENFPAVLNWLGRPAYSRDPADYLAAAHVLRSVRRYVSLFSSSGYIDELAQGSLCLVMGYNGDIAIAAARAAESGNGNHIQVLVPARGAVQFFDTMVIPADAEHVDAAYAWINYILRPDVQAEIVAKVFYQGPVRAADARLPAALRDNPAIFLSHQDAARLIAPDLVGDPVRRLRSRYFSRFKTGVWGD